MMRTDSSDIRQFVHNNEYKLYNTGKFYNKQKDPLEQSPMKPAQMTEKERMIMERFDKLLQKYDAMRPPEVQALVKPERSSGKD
jgi:arylsulfatase A